MSGRPRAGSLPSAPAADLAEGLSAWPELDAVELQHVRERAQSLTAEIGGDAARGVRAAIVGAAAGARLALGGRLTRERADELTAWVASEGGTSGEEARVALFTRLLPEIATSATSAARVVDALLLGLVAFGPASGAAVGAAGEPPRHATGTLDGDALELPVPDADLVLRIVPAGDPRRCHAFAEETARMVGAAHRLAPAAAAGETAKLEAAQRRLRRLALDLHDGPAQDVAALAADAALLEADLSEDPSPARIAEARAMIADVRGRLTTLGRDIRDLAEVLEPRAILRAPLKDVLTREAAAFARRTGLAPVVAVDDELGVMTASQQIALARVAQEALTNVRDHAAATRVELTAAATAEGVVLVVVDDGRGFDVQRVSADASGERLGLAGMRERVRLLGGSLTVDSRPGGPTRVEATIPRWRPSS